MNGILVTALSLALAVIPQGKSFLEPRVQRDSVLVADQLEYGFRLDGVRDGTLLFLSDFRKASNDTLALVDNWKLDTLSRDRKTGTMDIRGRILVAPFEEGSYALPPILVVRNEAGKIDTLVFEPCSLEVAAIPIDTATFSIEDGHDIKDAISYPWTFGEVLQEGAPYFIGALVLVALGLLGYYLMRRKSGRKEGTVHEPAHVVALRELDKYRSEKYWEPAKQKAFYSGITDTLKVYIGERFGVDAPEMTTAELFDAIKDGKGSSPEDYLSVKELFEVADFVKFAKHTVPVEDNAHVLPTAVKFVMSTYQQELKEEQEGNVL